MRVSLKDRSVHERTGVTFVSVTADILYGSQFSGSGFPLDTEREACASSSTKHCVFHGVNDVLGIHFIETSCECLISLNSDVLFDIHGVDETAVLKGDLHLLGIEGVVLKSMGDLGSVGLFCEETLYGASTHDVGVPYLFHVFGFNMGVHDLIGIGYHERSLGTKAHASC